MNKAPAAFLVAHAWLIGSLFQSGVNGWLMTIVGIVLLLCATWEAWHA